MAVIVLASAAGAPGVTSTAIGLASTWKRSVILVDADPGAYQAILAGYLRGQISTGKGMQRVAEAHRDRRPLVEVVSDETIALSAGPNIPGSSNKPTPTGLSRRLLPGFSKPANATLFDPVWADLTDTLVGYESVGIDVIIDAGRLDPRAGLPQPVVDRADAVCVITRSDLRSIAATRGAVLRLREQVRLTGNDSNLGLVLLGENDPYGRREISNLLAVPVLSVVAEDPQTARVFSDGARRGRKFGRSDLVRSLHRVGEDLTAQVRRRRSRLGLDPDRLDPARLDPASLDHSSLDHRRADQGGLDPERDGRGSESSAAALPEPAVSVALDNPLPTAAPGVVDEPGAADETRVVDEFGVDQSPAKVPAMNAWLRAGSNDAGGAHA